MVFLNHFLENEQTRISIFFLCKIFCMKILFDKVYIWGIRSKDKVNGLQCKLYNDFG